MTDKLHDYSSLKVSSYCTETRLSETNDDCYTSNVYYPDISGNTLFQLEEKIVKNINEINSKYSIIIRCLDVSNTEIGYNADITTCPPDFNANAEVNNLKELIKKTNSLVNIYNNILTQYRGENNPSGISFNSYAQNYKTILEKYNSNLQLRNELDMKMAEVMQGDKSVSGIYKRTNESMVYTNVIWTVLASSFVYYIFVNLT